MKILLFGKNGQLGQALAKTLPQIGKLVSLGREDVDFNDQTKLAKTIATHSPDIIINASAYTAVDKAENDESTAFRINEIAVATMAKYASEHNTLLVHYSTDYVFDGTKTKPYKEADQTKPLNVYGKSKRAGEIAAQQALHSLTFRTSWVYSAHGNNFIKTILRLAKERESINIVADQIGVPTSAHWMAEITIKAINSHKNGALPTGIYHLVPDGETSWHQIAQYVVKTAQKAGETFALNIEDIHPITTEEYPLPAKRPKNSRLDNHQLSQHLGESMPDWKIGVKQVIEQIIEERKKHET